MFVHLESAMTFACLLMSLATTSLIWFSISLKLFEVIVNTNLMWPPFSSSLTFALPEQVLELSLFAKTRRWQNRSLPTTVYVLRALKFQVNCSPCKNFLVFHI